MGDAKIFSGILILSLVFLGTGIYYSVIGKASYYELRTQGTLIKADAHRVEDSYYVYETFEYYKGDKRYTCTVERPTYYYSIAAAQNGAAKKKLNTVRTIYVEPILKQSCEDNKTIEYYNEVGMSLLIVFGFLFALMIFFAYSNC